MWVRLGRCCTPVPGDEILGFVTRGQGVSVHRTDCPNVKSLRQQPERLIEVTWSEGKPTSFIVAIQVEALDRTRLLSDVATVLSDNHVNILSATCATGKDRITRLRFTFELADIAHLSSVLAAVKRVDERLRRLPRRAQLSPMRVVLQRVARASRDASTATPCRGDRPRAASLLVGVGPRRRRRATPSGSPRRSRPCGCSPTTSGKTNLALADVGGEVARGVAVHAVRRRAEGPPAVVDAGGRSRDAPQRWSRRSPRPSRRAGYRSSVGCSARDMEVELVNDGPFTLILDAATCC